MSTKLIIGIAVILLLGAGGFVFLSRNNPQGSLSKEKEIQTACPQILKHVCGVDRKTYDNECLAKEAKTTVSHEGVCGNESATDTSTWKTYRNEKYGFEVKYPETNQLYGRAPGVHDMVDPLELYFIFPISSSGAWDQFAISISLNPKAITADQFIESSLESEPEQPTKNIILSREVVYSSDGTEGKKFILSLYGNREGVSIVFNRNGNTYNIFWIQNWDGRPEFSKNQQVFEYLASSFKFIK